MENNTHLLPQKQGWSGVYNSICRGGSAGIRILYTHVTSSVMIIGVMRLSYNERAVPDGRFRHHLFQAVFMRTTYPSRYVYFRWSRVHTAVETAVTAPVDMWERCKSQVQLQASEIGEIQAPIAHECRLLSRPDLHQIKDLFLCFLKILTWWGWHPPLDLEL